MRSRSSREVGSIQCTSSNTTSSGSRAASASMRASSARQRPGLAPLRRQPQGRAALARRDRQQLGEGREQRGRRRAERGEMPAELVELRAGGVVALQPGGPLELVDHDLQRAVADSTAGTGSRARRGARRRAAPRGRGRSATCRCQARRRGSRPGPRRGRAPAASARPGARSPARGRPSAPGSVARRPRTGRRGAAASTRVSADRIGEALELGLARGPSQSNSADQTAGARG